MPATPAANLRIADVLIMGGGLAGLTLSIQLRQKHPELSITVLERQTHPVPEAAHKVGESSVEIGAHYFASVLGLKPHLMDAQLKKFGFRFFFSDKKSDLAQVTELGASAVMPTGSYQIDRGIFENFLSAHARSLGIVFLDSAAIRGFEMAAEGAENAVHTVQALVQGEALTFQARWLVDATGRASLVKRKLGLAQTNEHHANAVWFRVNRKIDVNEWSNDEAWLDRCTPRNRWLSTNHLVGKGYWVWLIPLASGSHSVGIVCDSVLHPLHTMDTFDKAMEWIKTHQPRLHQDLDAKRDGVQDFAYFKKFSYGCKQVFSGAGRWALTGEAGVFLDPFYSPGSDFIAMSNTLICELVTMDVAGKRVSAHAEIFQNVYLAFYKNMLPIYQNQYPLFADPHVLPIKLLWDYAYYWGVMCQLFFQNKLTDLKMISKVSPLLDRAGVLNGLIQALFSRWGDLSAAPNQAVMLDQFKLDWFLKLNASLTDALDDEAFIARLQHTTNTLEVLAAQTLMHAKKCHPSLDVEALLLALETSKARPFDAQHEPLIFPSLLALEPAQAHDALPHGAVAA